MASEDMDTPGPDIVWQLMSPLQRGLARARQVLADNPELRDRLEEQQAEDETFMAAYRPYHDTGDDALLWQWIEQQIGREPDSVLRARLCLDYRDLGSLDPQETREVLDPYRGSMTISEQKRLRESVTADVRRKFHPFGKHIPALKLHGGERETALRDLIAAAIAARGNELRLGKSVVSKVDYYLARELPPADGARLDSVEGHGLSDVLADPVDAYSGVEDALTAEQIMARAGLSPRELEVVQLKFVHGFERGEIARRLEVSAKRVDGCLERAVPKLRAAL